MSRGFLLTGLAAVALAAVVGLVFFGLGESSAHVRKVEVLSEVYTVDREYRSMMGPSSATSFTFEEPGPPELVWVTGYRAEVVDAAGDPMSQEFMCHANLDFDSSTHARLFGLPVYHTDRLFTLSQGQQEITLPEGFGLPFYTDEKFHLTTQVLNLNPDGTSRQMRHRVTLEYVRDTDLGDRPMRPLFMTSGWGLKLLDGPDGYYGVDAPHEDQEGASCLPGEAAGPDVYEDGFSRRFSGHWVVEPGEEVNRTLVTEIMNLPYDTTIHYVAAHLHPFAEAVALRDLTTGEVVYESKARQAPDRIGLDHLDHYSSVDGIPVYADHEYEIVSTYRNTTDVAQDSMAVMLFYLEDKQWRRRPRTLVPKADIAHVETPPRVAEERIVLDTNFGRVIVGLFPDAAPAHVERIYEMVRLGIYDGIHFSRLERNFIAQTTFPEFREGPPLTEEQKAAIRPIDAEITDLRASRGSVMMALHDETDPNSAEAAFFILLQDLPAADQKYTIVGKVLSGYDTLTLLTDVPLEAAGMAAAAYIEKASVVSRDVLRAEARKQKKP